MIVSILSAVVLTATFEPPQTTCPEDAEGKGFALVFAEKPSDGFEVFYKEKGKTWEDVPAAKSAAIERSTNPWLVFRYTNDASDFGLKVGFASEAPTLDGKMSTDFSGYFRADGTDDGLNNFGLHDIY